MQSKDELGKIIEYVHNFLSVKNKEIENKKQCLTEVANKKRELALLKDASTSTLTPIEKEIALLYSWKLTAIEDHLQRPHPSLLHKHYVRRGQTIFISIDTKYLFQKKSFGYQGENISINFVLSLDIIPLYEKVKKESEVIRAYLGPNVNFTYQVFLNNDFEQSTRIECRLSDRKSVDVLSRAFGQIEKTVKENPLLNSYEIAFKDSNLNLKDCIKDCIKLELTGYITKRQEKELKISPMYAFFSQLNGMTAELKTRAANKIIDALNYPDKKISFTSKEIAALNNGELGKSIKRWEDVLPKQYCQSVKKDKKDKCDSADRVIQAGLLRL